MTRRRAEPSSRWKLLLTAAVLVLLGGALVAAWLWPGWDQPASGVATVHTSAGPDASPTVRGPRGTPREVPATPVRMEIPAIAVATPLVRLGLMPDRTVEVPSDADLAGWFHRGPTPGRQGSAVILGHVDSAAGPAVFARLQELRPGDAVTVERSDGTTARFQVLRSVLYANADFPAARVYAAPRGRRLNLVTCGGAYDSTRGGYQSNLVVYTRVVG